MGGEQEFLEKISENFKVSPAPASPCHPPRRHTFGMYLGGKWYLLEAKDHILSHDPVDGLDVSILQNSLLAPVLAIGDPRVDKRIDFVGGIRGLGELERRVDSGEMQIAFSMFPTAMDELMAVADAGRTMPPKSHGLNLSCAAACSSTIWANKTYARNPLCASPCIGGFLFLFFQFSPAYSFFFSSY